MDFNQLRSGLILFHRNLLERAERTTDTRLKEAYLSAAKHLAEVTSALDKFDLAMKKIRELEKGNTQPN
ncbi:MAG TPA: hypothetical protein EYP11_04430 [Aquificaceae bacterium]|nr:hypothetical protein [Aquificaceae bacterium]